MNKEEMYGPCHCGSGKKYKFCCYQKDRTERDQTAIGDFQWIKLRKTEGTLTEMLLAYIAEKQGETSFLSAWQDFSLGASESIVDHAEFEPIFTPWFLFNWIPHEGTRKPKSKPGPKYPIAMAYLSEHKSDLDQYQRQFIECICRRPFQFYSVTDSAPGVSLSIRGILVPDKFTVKERQGSQTLKRGDIIYCRVLEMDQQAIMVGNGPYAIPPNYFHSLLDIRDSIIKDGETLDNQYLHGNDHHLRQVYLDIVEVLKNPMAPRLSNTDGDSLCAVEVKYDLNCSPDEAFAALKSLSYEEPDGVLLEEAIRDSKGGLKSVSLDWIRKGSRTNLGADNTVLGRIEIGRKRLCIEVNSEKRAKKIRAEMGRRLKGKAVFKTVIVNSIEHQLEKAQRNRRPSLDVREQDDLMSQPEVQAQIKEMAKRHWQKWIDEPIPALKGKTPRQSSKTAEGRKRLEALLLEYEWRDGRTGEGNLLKPDYRLLREKLGLDQNK